MIHIFNISSIKHRNGIGRAEAAILKELEELSPQDLEKVEVTGINSPDLDGGVGSRLTGLIYQWAQANNIPLSIQWVAEKFNYYREEMTRVIPVDQYGMSFQLRTTRGTTKWMLLNGESLRVFNEVIVPALPDRAIQAEELLKKWVSLERGSHAPAELVANTMELLED